MSEKEMSQEIERLRRELAEVREDRDNLHKMLCSMLPVDKTEITPQEFELIVKNAKTVDELFRDILPPDLYEEVRGGSK